MWGWRIINKLMTILEHTVNSYRSRRLHSAIREKRERLTHRKLIYEYDHQYASITLPEARWIFQHHERWSPHYLFFLLMASTGIRSCELVKVSISDFLKDLTGFTYKVAKSRKRLKGAVLEERYKERSVTLDPWVRDELLVYLKQHCLGKDATGEYVFVSPWTTRDDEGTLITNLLFPWGDNQILHAYWWKLRQIMAREGFDTERLTKRTIDTLKGHERLTHVLRLHNWRAFYCSLEYYRQGMDMKAVQVRINHTKIETTARYVKAASQLGSTAAQLAKISWAEITGYLLPHDLEVRC